MLQAARTYPRVAIDGEAWLLNGVPTYRHREYRGWRIAGLLLYSRMANAVFDDANATPRSLWSYPDTGRWDPDRNSDELVANLAHLPRARPDRGDRQPAGRRPVRLLPAGAVAAAAGGARHRVYRCGAVARAAGAGLATVLTDQDRLEIISEMDQGGVIFGDGIEHDRLAFRRGQHVRIHVAHTGLNLVSG